jgi:hypothetical protein
MDLTPTLTHRTVRGIDVLSDDAAGELGVHVAFVGREGGVSTDPYRSLNLALSSDDDPVRVTENRRAAAAALGFDPGSLVLVRQVHGVRVLEVPEGAGGVLGDADGMIARGPGVVLAVMTADCAPVIVAGSKGVALLHAGWRGIVGGVVERGLQLVGEPWAGWVGPSIHACCYEVGPEVVAAWTKRDLPVPGNSCVDPGAAAAHILESAGVPAYASPLCTHHDHGYFSYRRDGVTGRQGAFAWLS